MPSKGKKQSKTQSRASNSDRISSPQTPSSTLDFETSDEDLMSTLEEASVKYPSLIGKTAFIGRIIDIEHDHSIGCKIWLSESSMVASSFAPESIVSVSSPLNSKFSHSFPLSSLANECASHYGNDLIDRFTDEAGNYFALATILPSSKVVNNGVRLSSSLSNTMGNPPLGRDVFIYPAQSQIVPSLVTIDQNPRINPLLVHDCSELFLELVHSKNRLTRNNTSAKISTETPYDRIGNGVVGSPKTPLNQLKVSSSDIKQLTSPILEDSTAKLISSNGLSADPFDIMKLFGDETVKRVLEIGASAWLSSRCLLRGNFVTIPVLSQLCSFQVVGAKKLFADNANYEFQNGRSNDLQHEASQSLGYSNDAFIVKRETKVCLCLPSKLAPKPPEGQSMSTMDFDSTDIKADVRDTEPRLGGLSKEYAILKDIIVSSSATTLSSLGLRTTKGVLLHGPPGTGKTSLVLSCVHDAGVNLFSVNGPEIVGQYYGESERALHEVFESACQAAPAVVFIDELDAIAPSRKDGGEELSQRMVATLLNLMDGVSRTEGILVIAATNRPDSIEAALRRPGRLDREIEIGVPSPKQRLDILLSLLGEMEHSLSDIQVQNLAIATHGFVGADLATLCNEAALVCLRRYANARNSYNNLHGTSIQHIVKSDSAKDTEDIFRDYSDSASSSISNVAVSSQRVPSFSDDSIHDIDVDDGIREAFKLKVTFEDFEKAKMKVRPSAMREVILEVPKVRWEDVGGQKEVKTQLMEAVEWPQKHQDAFKRIGIRPPSGILMFGPPGCSKTLMARAVASEAGLNFLAVKGPELYSKWVGESEKAVKSLFAKARANAPSIIFFDEIDGLAGVRGKENEGVSVSDRVMSQLLIELDGLHQRLDVTVIAATNRPDKIDPALLRPGRFDRLLYVGPPNESDREEIFRIHLRKIPCCSDISFKVLASLTDGFTGADISFICRDAALKAMEENLHSSEIRMQHLKASIIQVQPSGIQSYQEFSEQFQRLVHSRGKEENIECQEHSSGSSWFPMWHLLKSIALFVRRLPEVLSLSHSSSSG